MGTLGPVLVMALLAAAGLLAAPATGARGQETPPAACEAWLDIAQEGGLCRVEPRCRAPRDADLTYRLIARKQGRAGASSSSQSGRVRVSAGQVQTLGRLGLGLQPGDSYEFVLEVFEAGRKVAAATAASPRGL